jgi:hypothetical protein
MKIIELAVLSTLIVDLRFLQELETEKFFDAMARRYKCRRQSNSEEVQR